MVTRKLNLEKTTYNNNIIQQQHHTIRLVIKYRNPSQRVEILDIKYRMNKFHDYFLVASQTTINQRAALSRTFACIADVIGARANGRGGLRSGPAANVAWQEGIELLKVCRLI